MKVGRKWTVCFTKKEAGFSGTEQMMMAMMITKVYFLLFSFYQSETRREKMCFEKPFWFPSFHISLLNLDGNGSNGDQGKMILFFIKFCISQLHLHLGYAQLTSPLDYASSLRLFGNSQTAFLAHLPWRGEGTPLHLNGNRALVLDSPRSKKRNSQIIQPCLYS